VDSSGNISFKSAIPLTSSLYSAEVLSIVASGGCCCCDEFIIFDDRVFWKFSKFLEKLCNMSRPDWEDRSKASREDFSKASFMASRRLAFSLLAAVGSFDLSLVAKFRKTSFGSSFGVCNDDADADDDAADDAAASSLCNGFGMDVCMLENFWTRSFPHLFTDSDAPAVLLLLWLSLSSSPLPTLVSSDVSPAIFVTSLIFFFSFPIGVFRSACSSTRFTIALTSFRSLSVKELLFRFATSRNKSETP